MRQYRKYKKESPRASFFATMYGMKKHTIISNLRLTTPFESSIWTEPPIRYRVDGYFIQYWKNYELLCSVYLDDSRIDIYPEFFKYYKSYDNNPMQSILDTIKKSYRKNSDEPITVDTENKKVTYYRKTADLDTDNWSMGILK